MGKKVKKHYTHTYSHCVRAEFCSICTMLHAKENKKWWQEPENWAQAVLCSASCHPWALHQGTWGDEKCNITRLKLLYIWTSRAAYASNHPMHMLILARNFTGNVSNRVLALVYKNQPRVIFSVLEQPTLSQRVKNHPPCLQWQVVLCARKACGSWALALQDAHLSTLGQGLSCGCRLSLHPLQWECLELV